MEPKQFTYTIGGKEYIQKPLVLGQMLLLAQLVKYVALTPAMNVQALVTALGMKLPDAFSIVLIPKGSEVSEKKDDAKRQALADEISFAIDPDTTAKVIEDFFECNPIASLLEKLSGLTEKVKGSIETMKLGASKPSSPSSAEETSQKETPSSGDSPSTNASRT